MRTRALLVATLMLPAAALAQPARPAFDVASIKALDMKDPNLVIRPGIGDVQPGGVWRATGTTLLMLLRYAYPGHDFPGQIAGAPEWYNSQWFVIEARAAATTTDAGFREMARTLLADRFHLRTHNEMRDLPGFALTLARSDGKPGAGMTAPAVDCDAYRAAKAKGGPLPVDPNRKPYGDRFACSSVVMPVLDNTRLVGGANWRLTAGSATLDSLVELFAQALGRPVVNRTGLTGVYDIELQYAAGPVSTAATETGPTARDAVASQLGLRVEDARTPVDVLVIDRVERPDPD